MNYKRLLCLVLMLAAIFALSACGDGTTTTPPDDETVRYTVTFDANGGSAVTAQSVKENGKATAPTAPTKNGYAFGGWFNGDVEWNFDNTVDKDVTLKAKWTKVDYTITYLDGKTAIETDAPDTYTVESETIALPNITKEHYDFLGWYKDEALTEKVLEIKKGSFGNVTLYAKFALKNYSITYHLYEGVNNDGNPISYNLSSLPLTLAAPTKDGYTFDGWYTDANYTTPVGTISEAVGNLVVYASWKSGEGGGDVVTPPVEEGTYTITYMDGDKVMSLEPTTFTPSDEVTLPLAEKAHYDFLGWYTTEDFKDGTKIEKVNVGTGENLVLYANFKAVEYTITYYLNGGTNSESNIVKYTVEDAEFKFFAPSRTNFTFEGWYTDANCTERIEDLSDIPGDITVYAKWVFNTDDGLVLPEHKF